MLKTLSWDCALHLPISDNIDKSFDCPHGWKMSGTKVGTRIQQKLWVIGFKLHASVNV